MRTTITLDDDVVAHIDRVRKARKATFKHVVNQAIREGLQQMESRSRPRKPFRTRTVDLGGLRIGSIDSVADALAIAESDAFRRRISSEMPTLPESRSNTG